MTCTIQAKQKRSVCTLYSNDCIPLHIKDCNGKVKAPSGNKHKRLEVVDSFFNTPASRVVY